MAILPPKTQRNLLKAGKLPPTEADALVRQAQASAKRAGGALQAWDKKAPPASGA